MGICEAYCQPGCFPFWGCPRMSALWPKRIHSPYKSHTVIPKGSKNIMVAVRYLSSDRLPNPWVYGGWKPVIALFDNFIFRN